MLKVVKFGGSSLSDGKQFEKVKMIIESDAGRRVVIVSAPGRRNAGDSKITDLLYLCMAHIKYDVSADEIFDKVKERFIQIKNECNIKIDIESELADIRKEMDKGVSSQYLVSRGEYLNAKLMADYLGYDFVDAKDWITFNYDGTVDYKESFSKLQERFSSDSHIVIPGFYGMAKDGSIEVFSRGGSDVTGAIAAAALDADVYENWTDVPGILMADPSIVDNPRAIPKVTFSELRELSHMGASVLHEDTVFPVRAKNILLNIKDTNNPEASGTFIREVFEDDNDDKKEKFITGITGRRNYTIINLYKNGMDRVKMLMTALEVCGRYEVTVEQIPCSIDSFSFVIPSESLENKKFKLVSSIEEACKPDNIDVTDGISLIAIIGRQMAYHLGISGKIFGALGSSGINIRTIEQGSDEINIMIGVATEDFEEAIRILYDSFAINN